jgi:hypothetical protein
VTHSIKNRASRLLSSRRRGRQLRHESLEARRLLTEFLTPFGPAEQRRVEIQCFVATQYLDDVVLEVVDSGALPLVPEQVGPLVRVAPHFVNRAGDRMESVEVGQTIWLEFTATDIRTISGRGVFSTYFDVDFGGADVEIVGESEFSDAYWVLRIDPANHG